MSDHGHGITLDPSIRVLPCPFCGSVKIDVGAYGDSTAAAFCTDPKCNCRGPRVFIVNLSRDDKIAKAVEQWNKRPTP